MPPSHQLTVLHAKFAKFLSWSQPFLYRLIQEVGREVDNVVICSRTANLRRFPTPEVYRIDDPFLIDESMALLTAAIVRARWRPDLIHAHFGWSAIRMVPLAEFLRVPLIATFGGRDVGYEMRQPSHAPLYRTLLGAAARVICVSEELRRQVLDHGTPADRVVVIHRGTDLDRFAFVDRDERRHGGPLRLLMVGRLVEKKGHRDALQAVSELTRAGVPVQLTVVGDGVERGPLLEACHGLGLAGMVEFKGTMDEACVAEQYRRSDLLLQPSLTASDGDTEGLPNVVVEAAATGLPVVATRHGGIVEAVRDGATGLLVEERDVAGLVRCIRGLAADPERRFAMGRAGATLARGRFDLGRQVARHLEVYREVVRERAVADPQHPQRAVDGTYFETLRRALLPGEDTIVGRLREISRRRFAGRSRPVLRAARRWPPEGLRRYGLLVPSGLRGRLRRLLGRMAGSPIRSRGPRSNGDILAPAHSLRRAALEFIASEGRVDELDPSWNLAQLERFLTRRQRQGAVPAAPGDGA